MNYITRLQGKILDWAAIYWTYVYRESILDLGPEPDKDTGSKEFYQQNPSIYRLSKKLYGKTPTWILLSMGWWLVLGIPLFIGKIFDAALGLRTDDWINFDNLGLFSQIAFVFAAIPASLAGAALTLSWWVLTYSSALIITAPGLIAVALLAAIRIPLAPFILGYEQIKKCFPSSAGATVAPAPQQTSSTHYLVSATKKFDGEHALLQKASEVYVKKAIAHTFSSNYPQAKLGDISDIIAGYACQGEFDGPKISDNVVSDHIVKLETENYNSDQDHHVLGLHFFRPAHPENNHEITSLAILNAIVKNTTATEAEKVESTVALIENNVIRGYAIPSKR